MSGSFLHEAEMTADVEALYEEDLGHDGFVWNTTRLWGHQPATQERLFALMLDALEPSGLGMRERGILVAAAASTLGDSYCSLAWGGRLARASDPSTAAAVLTGTDDGLTAQEKALAAWARKVVADPNGTSPDDVRQLRDAGLDDAQIFAVTVFVALRIAASTINDSLGAHPDVRLAATLPTEVVDAVDYGRPQRDS
jgi:uncharacterized peroxidase-related enzyme